MVVKEKLKLFVANHSIKWFCQIICIATYNYICTKMSNNNTSLMTMQFNRVECGYVGLCDIMCVSAFYAFALVGELQNSNVSQT